ELPSPMAAFQLDGEFYFSGSLQYDSTGDDGTDLVDFYQGSIMLSANSPNVTVGFPLAIDNCTAFPVIGYSDVVLPGDCTGQIVQTIERTWSATDACGNAAQFLQVITVKDTTPPDVTTPDAITVPADAGTCGAMVTVPPLTASDSCNNITITNDITGTADASGDYPQGTTTITWTVEDDCGNVTIVTQDVTVENFSLVDVVVELADLTHADRKSTRLNSS